MRDEYDVIIVGAGPAGLGCAIELQHSKLSVLVLEKNKIIGPKVCAGGITTKMKELGIPLEVSERLFSSVSISVGGKTVVVASRGLPFVGTIDRGKLGQFMVNKLSDKVTVVKGCQVTEIKEGFIVAMGQKIKYKYLVGADGSNSIIRKFLGLKNTKFLTAIQYLVLGSHKNLEFCFDADLFGPGYGWIFPHNGYASVGCCQDVSYPGCSGQRENFEKWLRKREIIVANAKLQGRTISFDFQGFNFGNKFLIGDAGGFASGLTGEGIYFGLVSGREVARKIINPSYQCEGISEILKIKRWHENTLKAISIMIKINKSLPNHLLKYLLGLAKNKWFSKKLVKHYG